MDFPEDLRYSTDHEWARVEDGKVRIGITDYAQDALGDVVYVEVPEVGTTVAASGKISEVESTKSVSDVYALDVRTGQERQLTHAAMGRRYIVHHYGGRFLTNHTARRGHQLFGWLSRDGSFEPILNPNGRPARGLVAQAPVLGWLSQRGSGFEPILNPYGQPSGGLSAHAQPRTSP